MASDRAAYVLGLRRNRKVKPKNKTKSTVDRTLPVEGKPVPKARTGKRGQRTVTPAAAPRPRLVRNKPVPSGSMPNPGGFMGKPNAAPTTRPRVMARAKAGPSPTAPRAAASLPTEFKGKATAPGQLKKAAGAQSARGFAPGQTKRAAAPGIAARGVSGQAKRMPKPYKRAM